MPVTILFPILHDTKYKNTPKYVLQARKRLLSKNTLTAKNA